MSGFDLVLRNGTCATASDTFSADIGIQDGRVTAIGTGLATGARDIDCTGKLVLPGGVDSHCHIEQESSGGVECADDFHTGSRSAAFGGTTTVIPFAMQKKGESLRDVVDAYRAKAEPKALIDYAFHLILSDPHEQALGQELPALIEEGITSFKVYMTYDALKLDDYQMLTVLDTARRLGAMTMVHAENHDVIKWLSEKLIESGKRAPMYHAVAHAKLAESEATRRAIDLAALTDTPLLIVHVSDEAATAAIRNAQTQGLRIYGETCPQYLFLTAADLDRQGLDGAKFCCSPPPRNAEAQEAIWRGLKNGTFQVFSSDHAPFRFDETGKLKHGPNASFKQIANGVPGLELRLPLLFSEGVRKGRLTLNEFVALTATNGARLYGLHPRKGTIAVGADADLAIWDPERQVTVNWETMIHDDVGYTPYEGKTLTGWPEVVISRGRIVVENETLQVDPGSGAFLECEKPEAARPLGRPADEMAIALG